MVVRAWLGLRLIILRASVPSLQGAPHRRRRHDCRTRAPRARWGTTESYGRVAQQDQVGRDVDVAENFTLIRGGMHSNGRRDGGSGFFTLLIDGAVDGGSLCVTPEPLNTLAGCQCVTLCAMSWHRRHCANSPPSARPQIRKVVHLTYLHGKCSLLLRTAATHGANIVLSLGKNTTLRQNHLMTPLLVVTILHLLQ